jgi:nucleotide-binding universal stress UspA family protein
MMRNRGQRAASEATPPASAFRALLIAIDLSPLSDRVLGRAALLPLADGVHVGLLHVVPRGLPPAMQRAAAHDARKILAEEARALGAALPRRAKVEPMVRIGVPATEIADAATEIDAELIVMGRGGGTTLREVFLGSTAERVIRRGRRPVLAVRLRPRAPYARPVLALADDEAAQAAVALSLRVVPPPRGRFTVVHAYDIPYDGVLRGGLSDEAMQQLRELYDRKALQEITTTVGRAVAAARIAPADAPSWRTHIRCGSPRTVVQKVVQRTDADLLVLGTRGHTGAAYAFLGSVAGDMLRYVACDALMTPPRRDSAR